MSNSIIPQIPNHKPKRINAAGVEIVYYRVGGERLVNVTSITKAIGKEAKSLIDRFLPGDSPEAEPFKDLVPTYLYEDGNHRIQRAVPLLVAMAYWEYWANPLRKNNSTKARAILKVTNVEFFERRMDADEGIHVTEEEYEQTAKERRIWLDNECYQMTGVRTQDELHELISKVLLPAEKQRRDLLWLQYTENRIYADDRFDELEEMSGKFHKAMEMVEENTRRLEYLGTLPPTPLEVMYQGAALPPGQTMPSFDANPRRVKKNRPEW